MSVASLVVVLVLAGSPPGRLAVIRPAPDFTLQSADGRGVTLKQFRGKVVFVSFIFTTCSGSCPATTHRLAKVQDAIARAGLKDQVQFVSITLDPARDTPGRLRDYTQLYEIDPANWCFLTGPADVVGRTLADWGMWGQAGGERSNRPPVAGVPRRSAGKGARGVQPRLPAHRLGRRRRAVTSSRAIDHCLLSFLGAFGVAVVKTTWVRRGRRCACRSGGCTGRGRRPACSPPAVPSRSGCPCRTAPGPSTR